VSSQYDEMVTGSGAIRPHWRGLMETVFGMSSEQLADKLARASTQMADDEIIALPAARPSSAAPPLDLLPLIVPESEWQSIAEGLAQRARLLDLILADLYGPQRLIEERLLPPYLVLGNPEFLRPMCHVEPAGAGPRLFFYAADLVRLPSGEWRVLADRTQAPAGPGYALHMRQVLSRTFPEGFRSTPVRRVDSFIELWRSSLRAVGAAAAGGDAHVALLTPGPYNDAYFEHVFLARTLGIALVQGNDLTVRGESVHLKTLGGLSKVDVIYRRVDGDYCDSLELREESALGVAGLVEAARRKNVTVVNMPGTALMESPAFTPFLPNLARRLLNQELLLPAVTTWWCGQKGPLAEVRAAMNEFALHNVFDPDPVPVQPALLSKEKRAEFEAELLRSPERYVARERMTPSLAPCLAQDVGGRDGERLVPKPVILRVMAVWYGGDWYVLPGGSARVLSGDALYRSMLRHSDAIKDTWVISEQMQDIHASTFVPPVIVVHTAPRESSLRSRTADDLFWLGRYVERLDSGLRQFVAALDRVTGGELGGRHQAELKRLAGALRLTGWIDPELASAPVFGSEFGASLSGAAAGRAPMRSCLEGIHRTTLAARDQLSLDMWRSLQRLANSVEWHLDYCARDPDRLLASLTAILEHIAAFSGLAAENMVRGQAWRFLDLGRRIERGAACAQVVSGVMAGPASQVEVGLRLSLELCDSTIAYTSQHPAEIYYAQALQFVLADRSNPRALLYQLLRIAGHLGEQTGGPEAVDASPLLSLIQAVRQFPLEISHVSDMEAHGEGLADLLQRAVTCLMGLSDSITRAFFTHMAPASTGFADRPFAAALISLARTTAEVQP